MLNLELSATTALTPLDGRYGNKVAALRPIFSEFGLIKYRSLVEVKWLQALADESNIAEVPAFSDDTKKQLDAIIENFSVQDAQAVAGHSRSERRCRVFSFCLHVRRHQ